MLGNATFTIVMSSNNMYVVVQTATSVHRRPWASASIGSRSYRGHEKGRLSAGPILVS
jgi:hypothetical protein